MSLQRRLETPALADRATRDLPEEGMVSMFVDGDVDEAAVQALGGSVGARTDNLRTVRIPASALGQFLNDPSLHSARLAEKMELQTMTSVPATGATSFWTVSPSGTFSGLTGKGVIVGIVDSGVDFRHKDFKTAAGKTRILYLWDQYAAATPHPSGFTYGTEWTNTQIDAGQCTQTDGAGHGTFDAGVAAGNGQGTIAGQPAYRYVGMAPEADLVVVRVIAYDTYYVDGVKYVFDRARALGKPAVCLIAAGKRSGPHDGTDPTEISINSMVRDYAPNRLVVAAAGNYGNVAIHADCNVTATTPGNITLNVPTTLTGTYSMSLDGWYNAALNYKITVKTPTGLTVGPVLLGVNLDQQTQDAEVVISNGLNLNSKGDKNVGIQINSSLLSGILKPGTYTITATSVVGGGKMDIWLGDYSLGGQMPTFVTGLDYGQTVTTPATADSVISVAAYTFRNSWTAANGANYGLAGNPVVGDICAWSGRGMRRDGVPCPDVTAPGQAIGSSRSGSLAVSGVYILPDSVHIIQTGTSIAAAYVAGALALELQAYQQNGKSLSTAVARQWLRSSATSDNYVTAQGATPNAVWGGGKLHVNNGGTTGVSVAPSVFAFAAPYPSPSRTTTTFDFSLGAMDLPGAQHYVGIQVVDVAGRIVRALPGVALVGPQRLVWDGRDNEGGSVGAGIYFARLVVGSRVSSQKFVRVSS